MVSLGWWQVLEGWLQHEPPFQAVLSPDFIWSPSLGLSLFWEVSWSSRKYKGICVQGREQSSGWWSRGEKWGKVEAAGNQRGLQLFSLILTYLCFWTWSEFHPLTERIPLFPLLFLFAQKPQWSLTLQIFSGTRTRDFSVKGQNT